MMVFYLTIMHPNNDVAIFRPNEVRKLIYAIPKNVNRERFEVCLFTGCRYEELIELHKKVSIINDCAIKVRNTKAKAKTKYRYVQLNNQGLRSVDYYQRHKDSLPSRQSWNRDLKRWCELAGIDSAGVCAKSTRKTWESWLVTCYSTEIERIFLSQGHSQFVALKHYLMLPFTDQDKGDMLFYVDGW